LKIAKREEFAGVGFYIFTEAEGAEAVRMKKSRCPIVNNSFLLRILLRNY
jgi:hypothetical protein